MVAVKYITNYSLGGMDAVKYIIDYNLGGMDNVKYITDYSLGGMVENERLMKISKGLLTGRAKKHENSMKIINF